MNSTAEQLMLDIGAMRAREIRNPTIQVNESVERTWLTLRAGPVNIGMGKREGKLDPAVAKKIAQANRLLAEIWQEFNP